MRSSATHEVSRAISDYSVFVKSSSAGCVIFIVYVDDIMISGRDRSRIVETKKWLATQVHIKDLGDLQYFLGMEFTRNNDGIWLSQGSTFETSEYKISVKI